MKYVKLDGPFCRWCTTRLVAGMDGDGALFYEDARGEPHNVCHTFLYMPVEVFMREVVVG